MLQACRTYPKLVNAANTPYVLIEGAVIQLAAAINRLKTLNVILELALNTLNQYPICSWCLDSVEVVSKFKIKCSETEHNIMRYIHSQPDVNNLGLKNITSSYVTKNSQNNEIDMCTERMTVKREYIDDCDEHTIDEITVVKHEVTDYSTETDEVVKSEKSDVDTKFPFNANRVQNEPLKIQPKYQINDGTFKCLYCSQVFDDKNGLGKHVKIHIDVKEFACSFCPREFYTRMHFKKHVATHYGECSVKTTPPEITAVKHEVTDYTSDEGMKSEDVDGSLKPLAKSPVNSDEVDIESESKELEAMTDEGLKCPMCSKTFTIKSRLKNHMTCHTNERPFKCTHCPKGFNDRSTLTKHTKIHIGIKEFGCDVCQRKFYSRGNLKKHVSTHYGERPYKCDICHRGYSRNEHLKQHRLTHTGEKSFECDICSKKFARRDSLIIHMMVHTGERKYSCEYCSKRFIDSSTMKKHVRSHTGDKPYECAVCKHRFTQKTHLKVHMRSHTGERPFTCSLCGKAFYSNHYLKIHVRTHTQERPYECAECKKRFSTLSNLSMHRKIHTGVRDFECGNCQKCFLHKQDLKKHMLVHTQERPFCCHLCSKAFKKKIRAKHHIMKMHKEVDISTVTIDKYCTKVVLFDAKVKEEPLGE